MSRHERHIFYASRPAVHLLQTLRFSSSTTQHILPAIHAYIFPAYYENKAWRLSLLGDETEDISEIDGYYG